MSFVLVALLVAVPIGASDEPTFSRSRSIMVQEQLVERGFDSPDLIRAFKRVPRHRFVTQGQETLAYQDVPVATGDGQTLYQASLSARLIDLLDLDAGDRVLEIGTGSGYDAALLSELADEVFTIEIDPGRADKARKLLDDLGYDNVHVRTGDGWLGWPEEAPFDAILLTAAPERVPDSLFDQLAVGGRMVVATGRVVQDLKVVTKTANGGREVRRVLPVRIGPMTRDSGGGPRR
ncbi:MAG: protein-L-isoaspartate(D-aspartate) O-methyltransferase [Acidobacteriota bacterium]